MEAVSPRHAQALELFAPLAETYDRYARLLSLGQDPRWRRFLVSRVDVGPRDTVLDVASGTGAVALVLLREKGCRVIGLDQSPEMLAEARKRLPRTVELVEGDAERLPFPDGAFDALTFTYLLRYVDDPARTLRELVRVVRPGGSMAGLEFGLPSNAFARLAWDLHTGVILPVVGRAISPGWAEAGRFLRGSIRSFYAAHPLNRQLELWRAAGIHDVRCRELSFGGGVVTWGRRV